MGGWSPTSTPPCTHSTVQYSAVQYSAVQCSTVQYSTVQYSTVQCNTVQCNTVQYTILGSWHAPCTVSIMITRNRQQPQGSAGGKGRGGGNSLSGCLHRGEGGGVPPSVMGGWSATSTPPCTHSTLQYSAIQCSTFYLAPCMHTALYPPCTHTTGSSHKAAHEGRQGGGGA